MKKILVLFFLFITTSVYAFEALKVCYDASFLFKVGESCIEYQIDQNGDLQVQSHQYTTGTMAGLYPLEQKVVAYLSPDRLSSKSLFFFEKNKWKTLTHHYSFSEQVEYTIQKFKHENQKVSHKNGKKSSEGCYDPTGAVLYVQGMDDSKTGDIKAFFEGKHFPVSYRFKKNKNVEVNGEDKNCRVVDFKIPLKSSSMISPSGKWRLFIDEETRIIMRLELLFPLGKAVLKVTSITGDKMLLRKVIKV